MRRTGLGVAVLVAVLAAGCALPGAVRGPVKIVAEFDDVGDLVVDHSVQVADVHVGSISKIELTKDFKARVTMEVKDTGLAQDAVAELRTTSLLGEKFVELRACDPTVDGDICHPGAPKITSGFTIPSDHTRQAPELENIADYAARLLGGVAANDVATIVQTNAEAYGGRGQELRGIIDDLSTISATLADQTSNITAIIDGLDKATTALAGADSSLDQALVNLQDTTKVLADNRQQAVDTLAALTRLAQAQDQIVFQPYIDTVNRQVKQIDAILGKVTEGRQEVGLLVDWLEKFVLGVPKAIPTSFAQVYGWFAACPGPDC